MAWVWTTLKFNLKNICGYWIAINIIKGFLNFLVTYEKDLFTELAYEKVIDLWPVFSLFFLRCIQVHSFRFTWFYAFHSKRILIRAKRIYVQFPVEYCILQLICLTRGWCDTMRSLHCQTIMLLLLNKFKNFVKIHKNFRKRAKNRVELVLWVRMTSLSPKL